jgi:hypothetical protein
MAVRLVLLVRHLPLLVYRGVMELFWLLALVERVCLRLRSHHPPQQGPIVQAQPEETVVDLVLVVVLVRPARDRTLHGQHLQE